MSLAEETGREIVPAIEEFSAADTPTTWEGRLAEEAGREIVLAIGEFDSASSSKTWEGRLAEEASREIVLAIEGLPSASSSETWEGDEAEEARGEAESAIEELASAGSPMTWEGDQAEEAGREIVSAIEELASAGSSMTWEGDQAEAAGREVVLALEEFEMAGSSDRVPAWAGLGLWSSTEDTRMPFFQDPPRLPNQYDDDALLREFLARALPGDLLSAIEPELRELGELAAGPLREAQAADRLNEPVLTAVDPWGRRVDRIELTAVWKEAQRLSAERGMVAVAYERKSHEHSRVHQFALNYLVQASLDIYACPLAMTDGAARTLLELGNRELIDRAVPHLTSRDPASFWTSGQWMTERTGGSDVGLSETVARRSDDGRWRLHGTKFFTSAATSEMALTLGRPEGNGPGGRGLAVFYVETRLPDGSYNGIRINRLKDKLGTRKLPTAELDLEGTLATPVTELANGIRHITPMLNITRTWNATAAVWGARRGLALARDYAQRRQQFGAQLSELPLHVDTLAGIAAEQEGMFQLAFRTIQLLGRLEAGVASEGEQLLLRALTPLAKLTTAKQGVEVVSEAIECFGGAGYMEDTGLGALLRDTHVLPIWEGTTNVLSLDTLKALAKEGTTEALAAEVTRALSTARDARLKPLIERVETATHRVATWLGEALADPVRAQSDGRRLALTLGRTLELALLIEHAQWCLEHDRGGRALAAARRFAVHGIDRLDAVDADGSRLLAAGR